MDAPVAERAAPRRIDPPPASTPADRPAASAAWRRPEFVERPSFAEIGYWSDGDDFH